ncbi:zinc finger protein 253-like [Ixodes scapularis]
MCTGELVLDMEPLLVLVPEEDQSRYQCPHCSYSCTNRAYLQRHMRVHTGERPYRCDVCPSAFKDRSNLNRHRRCHTGEKPFKCPHCWRRFNQTSSLRTHVLGQHGTSRWR